MTRYSYRSDPLVPDFDDQHPIMVFDGFCGLCSGFIDFALRHDPRGELRFLPAQSELGEILFNHYGLKRGDDDYDTMLLIQDGHLYTKLDAGIRMISDLGWPWKAIKILRILPRAIGNIFYNLVARNRIKWFGARTTCRLPTAEEKARFL